MTIKINPVTCHRGGQSYDAEVAVEFSEWVSSDRNLEERREVRQVVVGQSMAQDEAKALAQQKVDELINSMKNWTTAFPVAEE